MPSTSELTPQVSNFRGSNHWKKLGIYPIRTVICILCFARSRLPSWLLQLWMLGTVWTGRAKTVNENFKIGVALLSRFDLVLILLYKPDEVLDKRVSEHIMLDGTVNGNLIHAKLRLTIPKEPALETTHKFTLTSYFSCPDFRSKVSSEREQVTSIAPTFRALPLNRKTC